MREGVHLGGAPPTKPVVTQREQFVGEMPPNADRSSAAPVMLTPREMGSIWLVAGVLFIAFRRRIAHTMTSVFEAPDLTPVTRTLGASCSFR